MAILKDLVVQSSAKVIGSVYGASFIKAGGTSSQFLKADGSVDNNAYALASAIPTVNDAILTVSGSGLTISTASTFTANASSNQIITITHPTVTSSYNSGLYKITTNSTGHVTNATVVTASDITGLEDWPSYVDKNTTLSGIGYCDAGDSLGIKNVILPGFELASTDQRILVYMASDNTKINAVLSVNGTTSTRKPIKIDGNGTTESNFPSGWWICQYDGTNWNLSKFQLPYSNITNSPSIPAAQVNSDWNATSGVAEILNKPTISDEKLTVETATTGTTILPFIIGNATTPENGHQKYRPSIGLTGAGELYQNVGDIHLGKTTSNGSSTNALIFDRGTASGKIGWKMFSNTSNNYVIQRRVATALSDTFTITASNAIFNASSLTSGITAASFVKNGGDNSKILLDGGSVMNISAFAAASNVVTSITTATGLYNGVSNAIGAVNFNIPSDTNHLTNGAGFITASDIPTEVFVCNYTGSTNTMNKNPTDIINARSANKVVICIMGNAIFNCVYASTLWILFTNATKESTVSTSDMQLEYIQWTSSSNAWSNGVIDLQKKLISGTDIKTINGNSLLGSGDISIESGGDTVTVPSSDITLSTTASTYITVDGTSRKIQLSASAPSTWLGTTSTTCASGNHTHGNITNGGTITTNTPIASGDRLVITDSSSSSSVNATFITFDGTTTTQFLSRKGNWITLTPDTFYVTCNTAATELNKKITIDEEYSGRTGTLIAVYFTYGNTAVTTSNQLTLDANNTDRWTIKFLGNTNIDSNLIKAGDIVLFCIDKRELVANIISINRSSDLIIYENEVTWTGLTHAGGLTFNEYYNIITSKRPIRIKMIQQQGVNDFVTSGSVYLYPSKCTASQIIFMGLDENYIYKLEISSSSVYTHSRIDISALQNIVTIFSGASTPDSNLGKDGDLFIYHS